MTIKSSGSLAISEINDEFELGTNLGAYRGVTWYTAGGSGTFTNTNLGMDQFYGKSATPLFTLQDSPGSGYYYFSQDISAPYEAPYVYLDFSSDGTWLAHAYVGATLLQSESGNWGTPTTSGIGSNYSIRFTRTSTTGSGTSTASTGFLSLSSARRISVAKADASEGLYAAQYTVEIATSGGGTVLKTFTGITLDAEVITV